MEGYEITVFVGQAANGWSISINDKTFIAVSKEDARNIVQQRIARFLSKAVPQD